LRGVRVRAVCTTHGSGFFFYTSNPLDDLFDPLKGIPRADRVDDEKTFAVAMYTERKGK
jgi:hypothetical protein